MSEWVLTCIWFVAAMVWAAMVWAALMVISFFGALLFATAFYLVNRKTTREARNNGTGKSA